MILSILTRQIHRRIENTGKYPKRIGLTIEQYHALVSEFQLFKSADLAPVEELIKFKGIPIEIVEVKE